MIKLWENKKDCEFFLKVGYDELGHIDVYITDTTGERLLCGNILTFTAWGVLIRNSSINRVLADAVGISLDTQGRIKEWDE